jgi:hypothetical protein
LTDILCHREQRYVSKQLTVSYDRKQIILYRSGCRKVFAVNASILMIFLVNLSKYAGKASRFPIASSEKNQRVSHTAVVENKRLGHALALVKAQQDMKYQPQINQQREDRLPEKARTKDLWATDGKSSGGNDGLMGSVEDQRNAAFSSVSGINVIYRATEAWLTAWL